MGRAYEAKRGGLTLHQDSLGRLYLVDSHAPAGAPIFHLDRRDTEAPLAMRTGTPLVVTQMFIGPDSTIWLATGQGLLKGEHRSGTSPGGAWLKKPLDSAPLVAGAPLSKIWWLIGLVGFFVLSLLYLIRRYQIRRLLEDAERLRLLEMDALKTKLYTNITHEFRTPLTVITGMAAMVVEQPAQAKEIILRNAHNLLRLVNQMLDVAKIDAGKMAVQWEQGDVVVFLEYLCESFGSYAATKHLQLAFCPTVKSLEINYDREKMQQIVVNLLSNAIKFTPKGGKVALSVSEIAATKDRSDNLFQIEVTNSGAGIPAEHLPQVFDRFYQVNDLHTRTGEGTGIGLALAKDLVELMGGRISAKSVLGEGATFTVLLPIRKTAAHGSDFQRTAIGVPPPATMPAEWGMAEPLTDEMPLALLIEDNADVATYVRACLKDQFAVAWAENGQAGIDKALEIVPDIIICDVMMPEKNGFEVTEFLKNDERTSHIPIVLLTAKTDTKDRIAGLERGADAYLSKPFDKKELQVRVQKLVALRQLLQSRYAVGLPFRLQEAHPSDPKLPDEKALPLEDGFLKKINSVIEQNLSEAEFDIPELCKALQVSHSQLFRKIKALTGKSIAAYIRSYRLHRGRELLKSTDLNSAEVAYSIGFTHPSYFSRMYFEEFGESPTEGRK